MHQERTVRISSVVAWVLWAVSICFTLAGTLAVAGGRDRVALAIYAHGVLAIGAAATVTLLSQMDKYTRRITQHVELHNDVGQRIRQMR